MITLERMGAIDVRSDPFQLLPLQERKNGDDDISDLHLPATTIPSVFRKSAFKQRRRSSCALFPEQETQEAPKVPSMFTRGIPSDFKFPAASPLSSKGIRRRPRSMSIFEEPDEDFFKQLQSQVVQIKKGLGSETASVSAFNRITAAMQKKPVSNIEFIQWNGRMFIPPLFCRKWSRLETYISEIDDQIQSRAVRKTIYLVTTFFFFLKNDGSIGAIVPKQMQILSLKLLNTLAFKHAVLPRVDAVIRACAKEGFLMHEFAIEVRPSQGSIDGIADIDIHTVVPGHLFQRVKSLFASTFQGKKAGLDF